MERNLRQLLAAWWTDTPDRWLADFLEARGVLVWIKRVIAGGGALLAAIVVLSMCTPHGPQHPVARALAGMLVAAALAWSLWWLLRPWPTHARSLWFVATCDAGIALVCWLDAQRLAGLTGTAVFALTGAYVTFFHGPRTQAVHIAWTVLTTVTLAIAVGMGPEGWASAAARALLCLLLSVSLLPGLQLGFWVTRQNAADSLVDPLTGLANRRGLDYRFDRLPACSRESPLCVFAIELDHFKALNDRYGRQMGDGVLIQAAARIRASMGSGALIARIGGPAFVAIDRLEPSSVQRQCERIRRDIARASNPPVTASIGATVMPTHDFPSGQEITAARARADIAVDCAKSQGGNTVRIHPPATTANVITQRSRGPVGHEGRSA